MLKVTARIFDNKNLWGYVITDGVYSQAVPRSIAWSMARNKQIMDVEASISNGEQTLSGKNGFKLKDLPEKKYDDNKDRYVVNSAAMKSLKLQAIIEDESLLKGEDSLNVKRKIAERAKNILSSLVKNGLITSAIGVVGQQIEVIGVVYYSENSHDREHGLPLGYRIKNVGDNTIKITRIQHEGKRTLEVNLISNQEISLSKLEIALLASRLDVTAKFKNASLCFFTSYNTALELCKKCIINIDDEERKNSLCHDYLHYTDGAYYLKDTESRADIVEYFGIGVEKEEVKQNQLLSTLKLSKTNGVNGLFNAFKR